MVLQTHTAAVLKAEYGDALYGASEANSTVQHNHPANFEHKLAAQTTIEADGVELCNQVLCLHHIREPKPGRGCAHG